MVFAPFTGLDNHYKCVTFAGGLLLKEDVESYSWLFKSFVNAVKKAPRIIITDQDPAMKIAIKDVLPNTRHRLCMWHIMTKVSKKVGAKKINSKSFRKKLANLVWGVNKTVEQFEEQWTAFIEEQSLQNNGWFSDMYAMRSYWIEAYFRDVLLGGLMRTTSISESQNSFFGAYTGYKYTLLELVVQFDTAMETQRYHQMRNDIDSESKSHDMKTPLQIEKHASEYYTLNVFKKVQEEIYSACFNCFIVSMSKGT